MHRALPFLTRAALPLGTSLALLAGACTTDDGGSPGPAGASGGVAGTGKGGSGGSSPGAGTGGTGGKSTAGTGGGAGQLGSGGTGGASGSGGTTASGSGGGGSGGMPSAGQPGTGGAAGSSGGTAGGGGVGVGGSAGASAGTGGQGTAGTSTGSCPSGITDTPTLGPATRVASVPPPDSFNMNNGTFGNIEGPLWLGDALYVSEMGPDSYTSQDSNIKKSRILKVTPSGQTSIFIADSGSNGLASDADGNIVAAVHKDGSITRFAMPSGTPAPIVGMYMGARFNSPNDLAIHSNGTIYFSDPSFQAPNTLPQAATRVYRVAAGGQTAEPIPSASMPDTFNNPNGVTLSLAEDYLYVAASTGRRYPVMSDGTLGAGADYAPLDGGDGLAVDCAGNLYVAKSNQPNVVVYKPDGSMIGQVTADVQAVTNVAFGGADGKTLYVTGLGNNKGLFQLPLNIPGRPY